jgi:hypothetical protein
VTELTSTQRAPRLSLRPVLVVIALLVFLPTGATASPVALTSQRLTTLTTCGLISSPSSANLTTDVDVTHGTPTTNNLGSTDLVVSSADQNDVRTYIRFPITSCPNAIPATATVRSASLRLFTETQLAAACRPIDVYPVAGTWSESVITWTTQPFGTAINTPASGLRTTSQDVGAPTTCANHALGAYVAWDVTDDLARFVVGSATNYGWMIRDDAEGSPTVVQSTAFYSRRANISPPELMISYTT